MNHDFLITVTGGPVVGTIVISAPTGEKAIAALENNLDGAGALDVGIDYHGPWADDFIIESMAGWDAKVELVLAEGNVAVVDERPAPRFFRSVAVDPGQIARAKEIAELEYAIDDCERAYRLAIEMESYLNVSRYALKLGDLKFRLARANAPGNFNVWSKK